jgi:hypothetical protein
MCVSYFLTHGTYLSILIVIDFNYFTNNFILMHPIVFSSILNRQKYADQYNTLMSYHSVLYVSVCMNCHQTLFFTTI